jgi:predicted RNA-binding protein with PUA-like domain
MPETKSYWLMKSEPAVFSIEDLSKAENHVTFWDGVRNYRARNFLRDQIKPGDGVLFYHSNTPLAGIAGEAVVVRGGTPDPTAFDPDDVHYDPKSRREQPTWYGVEVRFVRACRRIISLDRLREFPALKGMTVLKRGMRLSVQPVSAKEWAIILHLPEWEDR